MKYKKLFYVALTVIVILIVFILFIQPYVKDTNSWLKEREYKQNTVAIANERLEYLKYGVDKDIDYLIRLEAQAENWFPWTHDDPKLIKTRDISVPFVAHAVYRFVDSSNEKYRILEKTYIYDDSNYDWVPLSSTLKEYSAEQIKLLENNTLWQGDYEIPFFK